MGAVMGGDRGKQHPATSADPDGRGLPAGITNNRCETLAKRTCRKGRRKTYSAFNNP